MSVRLLTPAESRRLYAALHACDRLLATGAAVRLGFLDAPHGPLEMAA